jgi:type II secretory pathway pseudopilin PulG
MLEVILVVSIVGLLVSMATQSFGGVTAGMSTRSSREALVTLKAVARARAVERGATAKMIINFADARAYVIQNDTVRRSINLGSEYGVAITAEESVGDSLVLCLSPRGYPDIDCNSFSVPVTLGLTLGPSVRRVTILPMGVIN